jgi:hypothetical protein
MAKISPIGEKYKFNNPQWYFLKFAEFSWLNHKICIKDIKNNTAYKMFYAKGCVISQHYERDITALIEALDLVYELYSDLGSCIIFNSESTKKLLNMGFCLKTDCQRAIYKQNNWKLFSVQKIDSNDRIAPYFCPEVLVNEIFDLVYQI